MSHHNLFGAAVSLAMIMGCHADPQGPGQEIRAMQCTPETCSGGGDGYPTTDPAPQAPGIWIGANVGLSRCYDPRGTTIVDVDGDRVDDWCEQWIAYTFRPMLRTNMYDCDLRGEPAWGVKYFPETGIIRVGYFLSYYQDCGNDYALGCTVDPTNECHGHEGDSEFIVMDLRYDSTTDHYLLDRAFLSAHFDFGGSFFEQFVNSSSTNNPYNALEYPTGGKYRGYPRIWVSRGKHGNYPTRDACDGGGAGGTDTCDENFAEARMDFIWNRNIGSPSHHMLNCTPAKPEMRYFRPGTECYWDGYNPSQSPPPERFFGWWWQDGANPYSGGSTPYGEFIRSVFEPATMPGQ